MPSFITKQQLATRVLQRLGEYSPDQPITAADMDYVCDQYDAKRLEWRENGACWWPNTDDVTSEIPIEASSALEKLMLNEVGPAFGRPMGAVDQMAAEEALLRPLRRLMAKQPSGEATTFDAY